MRVALLVLSAVLSALFLDSSAAQQTASSSTQASQLMQQSLAALQGNTSISDITLTGTARRIAGSDDRAGPAGAQQAPTSMLPSIQQDPQALAVLQGAFAAMGGSVPSDSTANGTVTTVAGSQTESGSVIILTRGTDQTSEQIQTPHGSTVVYSNLQASQVTGSVSIPLSSELAASSRPLSFPLPQIAAVLNNPDSGYLYVGLESLNGLKAHHLRYWNSFNAQPRFQFLAEFTLTDIWIDAVSGLPQRISQIQRAGRASEPRIQLDTYLSNYQKVSGVLYPFSIQKSLNGSPWISITITNVTFNTGLTDANFVLQ